MIALILAALVAACSSSSEPVAPPMGPFTMRAVDSSSPWSAVVNTQVAGHIPAVQIRDKTGKLAPGILVTFTADGGSHVTVTSAQTDTAGIASSGGWTLGTVAQLDQVTASASNANNVYWSATGTPDIPTVITVAPTHFTSFAGDSLLLIVSAHDQFGNAIFRPPSTFSSADPSVATITSPEGVEHSVALGKTSLTVHSGVPGFVVPVTVPTWSQAPASGTGSWGVDVNKNDVMYVTKPLAQLVERYDLPSHTRTLTIPMPGEPVNVAFIPDGTKAYVSDFGIAQVNVIDVATNTVTAHVAMPGVNNYILASTDGSKVYVTVGTKLCAINTATNAVTTVFNSDGGVSSLTMNPATPWMYFFSDSGVYEWDQGADTVRRHGRLFPIGDNVFVQDMAFSADGSKLFVADEIGELRVHDGVTFAFQSFFPFWTDGFGLKVTKDGSKIWMTRPTSPGPLAVAFDESTHEELVSYSAGRSRRIAFDKSGNTAIITSETGYLTFITWP